MKIATIIFSLVAFVSCFSADSGVTNGTTNGARSDSPPRPIDDDEGIKGYLTDLTVDNATVECVYSEVAVNEYSIRCSAGVERDDGTNVAATGVAAGVKVKWLPPAIKRGGGDIGVCQTTDLTIECPFSGTFAELAVSLQVASVTTERTVETSLLLPYSVEVVAGLVPSLAQGTIAPWTIEPRLKVPSCALQSEVTAMCRTGEFTYFAAGRVVYQMRSGTVQHFLGQSVAAIREYKGRYGMHLSLKLEIACSNEGIIVVDRENDRLYAYNHNGDRQEKVSELATAAKNVIAARFVGNSRLQLLTPGSLLEVSASGTKPITVFKAQISSDSRVAGVWSDGTWVIHAAEKILLINGQGLTPYHLTQSQSFADIAAVGTNELVFVDDGASEIGVIRDGAVQSRSKFTVLNWDGTTRQVNLSSATTLRALDSAASPELWLADRKSQSVYAGKIGGSFTAIVGNLNAAACRVTPRPIELPLSRRVDIALTKTGDKLILDGAERRLYVIREGSVGKTILLSPITKQNSDGSLDLVQTTTGTFVADAANGEILQFDGETMKTVASGICHPGQIVEDGMGNLLVTSNFGPDRCSKNTVSKIDKAGNVEIWTTLEAPAVEATTVAGEYFYFAAGNQIGRVHLATKEQTQFFTLPSNGEINALAVADADHLAVGSNRGALALLSISRKHLEVLFGAQQLRTCSMRRAAGSTVAAGIDTKIRQSLAGICPGSSILDISTHQCSGGSQQVAFAQSFPDGRAIVAIKRPCLEGL